MDLLAKKLKELRKNKAVIQKEVAQKIEISERQYIDLENGKKTPTLETAIKLANYFDVSLDWLTGRDKKYSEVDLNG